MRPGGGHELVKPRPDALKGTLVALARLLMVTGPEWSEEGWRICEEVEGGVDEWFVLQWPHHKAYMLSGEFGRFRTTKPEGVEETTMRVVDLTGPMPTRLREYLAWVAGATVAIDAEWDAGARRIVESVAAAASLKWMRGEMNELMMAFVMKPQGRPDRAVAKEAEERARDRFLTFQMPGMVAATICLLTRIAYLAGPRDMVHESFMVPGRLNLFATPQVFLLDVLRKIGKLEGGPEKIAEACAELLADAEALADAAEAAQDSGGFHGSIFASVPLAYAGQQGFDFLAEAGFGKPREYRMQANVCEERVATAMASLVAAFENAMDWRALERHRALIAAARQCEGNGAAEMLADQYVTHMLLYPQYLRRFLLGATDVMPRAAAEA